MKKQADTFASIEQFTSVLDVIPLPLFITDINADISYVNKEWSMMTGFSHQESLGQKWREIVVNEDHAVIEAAIAEYIRNGTYFEVAITIVTRQGTEKGVLLKSSRLPGLGEDKKFFAGTLVDITKIISAEKKLKSAKLEAERANLAKSDFLSIMSHEIRTPLNAVVGMSNLLLQDNPSPHQMENLEILKFSAQNLLFIINDILEFSRIEAGKVELEIEEFDLKALISNLRFANNIKAEEAGNKIELQIDPECPDTVIGDQYRISQILNNLISNAIKFTENGVIRIELRVQSFAAGNVSLELSVSDTGIGIAPGLQSVIFEKFTQANSQINRKYGGSGLGLAITSRLLMLMKSGISLQSEEGEGSIFSFRLELPVGVNKIKPQTGTSEQAIKNLKGARILVVEDNKINAILAKKFLEAWNAQTDIAENGLVAVEKIRTLPFDLVLMDLQMPLMDGYTATFHIREFNPFIPIIALTASIVMETQQKTEVSGMNDYVFKPFEPNELYNKIYHYLNRKSPEVSIPV